MKGRVCPSDGYTFTVPTDYTATSDLMFAYYAYSDNTSSPTPFNSYGEVTLPFSHMLSSIQLTLESDTDTEQSISASDISISLASYPSRKISGSEAATWLSLTATAKKGTDRITASATITVSSPSAEPGMVSVSSDNAIVYAGQSSNKVTLAASSSLTSPSYAWSITSGGSYVSLSAISGSSVTLTGSTAGTATIRCYATGSDGFHYDDVTVAVAPSAGAVGGVFTVSSGGTKVSFSQGNLTAEVDASGSPTAWWIREHQYDYVGNAVANKSIGSSAGSVDFLAGQRMAVPIIMASIPRPLRRTVILPEASRIGGQRIIRQSKLVHLLPLQPCLTMPVIIGVL